jgi:hypothetical protein
MSAAARRTAEPLTLSTMADVLLARYRVLLNELPPSLD